MQTTSESFEVIIIGGSYAGLSAAMALGRFLRKVLVIDAGKPCNAQTPHSHNFLTQDGRTPSEIIFLAKEQVLQYPTICIEPDSVVRAGKQDAGFVVSTEKGKTFTAKKLLLATGVKDIFPETPGIRACWGISVLHCPYCHGYEVRGSKLAIIGNGEMAVDFVKLILQWSTDLCLLTNGPSKLSENSRQFLGSVHVPVIENRISEVIHQGGQLTAIVLENGEKVSLNAAFIRLPFDHHTTIAKDLGCTHTDLNHIVVDELGKTSVPGVYAAGDCASPMRSVSNAVGAGTKAGAAINRELIEEKYPEMKI